jgi:hypothetical protein
MFSSIQQHTEEKTASASDLLLAVGSTMSNEVKQHIIAELLDSESQ